MSSEQSRVGLGVMLGLVGGVLGVAFVALVMLANGDLLLWQEVSA